MPITTIESLREHLQWAIQLEHATIPPYLTALYSIKAGTNIEAREVVESVFIEEMLHMVLAANVLNAIGGHPKLDYEGFIAQYPAYLPHSNKAFKVPLLKLSPEAIDVFMQIEKPEAHDALPEDDNFETIGQFYEAIEEALQYLCTKLGEENVFTGDPAYQIGPDTAYYGGSGHVIAVTNLASAMAALEEIIEQGEGHDHVEIWDGDRNMFHPEREEVAHYYRFNEIKQGRAYQKGDTPQSGPTGPAFNIDWDAIYNVVPNPRATDYAEGTIERVAMDQFNQTYSHILRLLERAFNGETEQLSVAIGEMYEIKYEAIRLMNMPSGQDDTVLGPSFDYVPAPNTQAKPRRRIIVRPDGPYIVYGDIPLVRKAQIISEHGEPLTWHKTDIIPTDGTYALCRCGQSSTKPFCDGTHARVDFDGTETADTNSYADRQEVYGGHGITVKRDHAACMESGFCGNRFTSIPKMIDNTDDSQVRAQVIAMVERCPSGAYTYSLTPDSDNIEPDYPVAIAVTQEGEYAGSLWITGNIPLIRADGKPFETRNRVTLCRCGQSANKPLCDGTHREINFTE
ncbi:MAG TPA: ferritin-like domain-containing protein [Anaerolineae bacterium]|nr:ferritin-like domain-containing protein [Anaerolineae bacterium]